MAVPAAMQGTARPTGSTLGPLLGFKPQTVGSLSDLLYQLSHSHPNMNKKYYIKPGNTATLSKTLKMKMHSVFRNPKFKIKIVFNSPQSITQTALNRVQLGRQAQHREGEDRMLISLNSKSQPVGDLDIYLPRGSAHIQYKATTASIPTLGIKGTDRRVTPPQSEKERNSPILCLCVRRIPTVFSAYPSVIVCLLLDQAIWFQEPTLSKRLS